MGRHKLPDTIKKLRGTAQPCRLAGATGIEAIDFVSPPSFLKKRAKKIFEDKAKQLIVLKIMSIMDVDLLAAYAMSYAAMVEAHENVLKEGYFIATKDEEGEILESTPNPWIKIYNDSYKQVVQLGALFGFAPTSRNNGVFSKQPDSKENEFDQFE